MKQNEIQIRSKSLQHMKCPFPKITSTRLRVYASTHGRRTCSVGSRAISVLLLLSARCSLRSATRSARECARARLQRCVVCRSVCRPRSRAFGLMPSQWIIAFSFAHMQRSLWIQRYQKKGSFFILIQSQHRISIHSKSSLQMINYYTSHINYRNF